MVMVPGFLISGAGRGRPTGYGRVPPKFLPPRLALSDSKVFTAAQAADGPVEGKIRESRGHVSQIAPEQEARHLQRNAARRKPSIGSHAWIFRRPSAPLYAPVPLEITLQCLFFLFFFHARRKTRGFGTGRCKASFPLFPFRASRGGHKFKRER